MAGGFELTPMKAFLKHRKESFVIDDAEQYKRVTVRLHAQGVVLRDQVYGSQLRTKKQQVAKTGDLLVAEIDAKVGGVGIVPSELAGAIVSSHYFLYEIDEAVCHPKYLEYYRECLEHRRDTVYLQKVSAGFPAQPDTSSGQKCPNRASEG